MPAPSTSAVITGLPPRPNRHPWREIAPLTGMPWQTLYRRYRHRPERLARVSVSVDEHGSVGNVPRAGV